MVNTGFYIDAQDRIWWTDDPLLVTHVPYVDEGVTDRVRLVPVGEFPTLVDTVSIERRIGTDTNGQWVRIADHIDPQLTLTDPIPLLGHNTYRVISHSADGAASIGPEFEIDWEHDSCPIYVNTGDGWQDVAAATTSQINDVAALAKTIDHSLGVRRATATYGTSETRTITVSSASLLRVETTPDTWRHIEHTPHDVCFRDCGEHQTGIDKLPRRVFGMIQMTDGSQDGAINRVGFTVTETETTETADSSTLGMIL